MTDRDLTIALCELLGTVPGWGWAPNGPLPSGPTVSVVYGALPPSPDQAVGVRIYGGDDPRVYAPRRYAQILTRGARGRPDGADDLADVVFTVLQGRCRVAGIGWIERTTFGPLGPDINAREQRADNYLISIDNMEANHV